MNAVKSQMRKPASPAVASVAIAAAALVSLRSLLKTRDVEYVGVPGVLEELKKLKIPLDDPLVGLFLSEPEFISFAFWADEADFVELAHKVIRGEQTYDNIIRDGVWNRVSTWLDGFDRESVLQPLGQQRIPIAEIHSPHIKGCDGTFATTRAGVLDVSIKAFGLGYGRAERITVSQSYVVPQECRALTTGVDFEVHVWKQKSSNKRRALVRVLDIDGSVVDEPLDPTAVHQCVNDYQTTLTRVEALARQRGQKMGRDYSDFPMHKAAIGAVNTQKFMLEKGSVYSASLGLSSALFPKLSNLGLPAFNLGICIESRVSRTVEISWKLVGGHDYVRFRKERDDMRIFWAWK